MSQIVYLNGEYVAAQDAKISPLDRGFLFADGVYEVIPIFGGRLLRGDSHLRRLDNSLQGIRMENPHTLTEWRDILEALIEKNGGGDLSVYIQVTRGAPAARNHLFPETVRHTVFCTLSPWPATNTQALEKGGRVILLEDYRWKKCQLKTVALLPNVLMRQEAKEAGADEVILIRDGNVSECSSCNAFIVKDGVIMTPPKSNLILSGITRELVLELAEKNKMPYKEIDFSQDALLNADEVWITSSSKEVFPIVKVDDKVIGDGKVGAVWKVMYAHYQEYKRLLVDGQVKD